MRLATRDDSTLHHEPDDPRAAFQGVRVLVMGLGVHGGGLGVARWLYHYGAHVTITDMADAQALTIPLAQLDELVAVGSPNGGTMHYVLGEHRFEDFQNHEVVVVNPAVRPDSPWIAHARQAGARIETEMTLFFRYCPGPILGITGTKGKTTTATLTAAILRQHDPNTLLAGNLRVSALDVLERITPTTPVVLELSSFQLMGLGERGYSPSYACITNLAPDHLNYHGTMDEYADAKRHIFLHQQPGDIVVLPHQEAAFWLEGADSPLPSTVKTFSTKPGAHANCAVTIGPEVNSAHIIYHDNLDDLNSPATADNILFALDDIRLAGEHNLANVMAAATLAKCFGVAHEKIKSGVRSFHGVEHRLEPVATLDDVRYVNDTTATNPVAVQASLASFEEPIVLLAGGADKGLAFEETAQVIARRVKALILLAGSATEQLRQEVIYAEQHHVHRTQPLPIYGPYNDFAAAITQARAMAVAGDIVLLSPGCASFGMFRNEFHRGEEFRHIVTSLAGSQSETEE